MVYLGFTFNIICLVIVYQGFVYSTVNSVVVEYNGKEPWELSGKQTGSQCLGIVYTYNLFISPRCFHN